MSDKPNNRPTKPFQNISARHGLAGVLGAAAVALAAAPLYYQLRANAALEGIGQQIKGAHLDQVPDNRPVSAAGLFKNTLTGALGAYEVLGREAPSGGRNCYAVAITGGGFSMAEERIKDSDGKLQRVATVSKVCPR